MGKNLLNKKTFATMALAAACSMMTTNASAQKYFTEDFDSYNVGDLNGQGPWVRHGAGSHSNYINVEEGSLTYEGYSTNEAGNCAYMGNLKICDALQAGFDKTLISEGAIYVSALVNITDGGEGNPFLKFVRSKSGDGTIKDKDFGFSVGFMSTINAATEGKFKFGVGKIRANDAVYADEEFELNKTYLVVMKYEFFEGDNNDVISIWVNPTDFVSEPTPIMDTKSAGVTGQDLQEISAIVLARNTSKLGTEWNDMKIDAIHVAGAWKDLFDNGTDGISKAESTSISTSKAYYTLDGRLLSQPQKGINIVRESNGKVAKVMMK